MQYNMFRQENNNQKQKQWERDLERYERAKRAIGYAKNLNHEPSLKYWQDIIDTLESTYGDKIK